MTNRNCQGDLYTLDGATFYRCLLDGSIGSVSPEIVAAGVCELRSDENLDRLRID